MAGGYARLEASGLVWSFPCAPRVGAGLQKKNVNSNLRWGSSLRKRARGCFQGVFCVQGEKCGRVNVSAEVPDLYLLLL